MSPRTVFITGSNRGIGLGLVRELLKDKEIETLIAGARNIDAAKDLQDLAKSDSRLHLISVDVSCDESLQKALKEIEGLVDDRGLNLLINNAAICPPYRTIDPPNRAVVLECLNVNAVGALVTAQLFLPLLRKAAAHTPGSTFSASKAAILNVGSDSGFA
ncbi:hypothetical protein GCK72_016371 [Caenorhabditis remanei]|uniref:Uncharacterized protein n=1 Tax=Caenorhabditis remanei TaxID=31234 RepID=A0A6A5GZE6_CAERE|nr:hypothetical protein GCK72_016371 [Caenorhabditis remanei]KAF1759904.1 hypothetical protein GCK72_016371 [Caenorhabditis remanei]